MTGVDGSRRVGVTGADGFLAWHLRCRLAMRGLATSCANRETFASSDALDAFVSSVDVIIHVAGVNRANSDEEISSGNMWLADRLIEACERTGATPAVLYTNSTKSEAPDGAYGHAKRAVAEKLAHHQERVGARMVDFVIPHVFGEFGRPNYNSAITTFANALALGRDQEVNPAGELELLHAQDVAATLIDAVGSDVDGQVRMKGRRLSVGDAWACLEAQHSRYVGDTTVPAFADRFELQLFNTLRSQLFVAGHYPVPVILHSDERGAFAELARADGVGQTSISTSAPGVTRGDHFHMDKIERFVVVDGEAIIRVRRLLTAEVCSFEVTGSEPVFIDMPPLMTHNITNAGKGTLTAMFWAGDHFDPEAPDTYAEPVDVTPRGPS